MKWTALDADICAVKLETVTRQLSALDLASLVSGTEECPMVIFPKHVRTKILAHVSTKEVELGGLLVGTVVSIDDLSQGLVAIAIHDSVPSEDFESTSASLIMGASVWQRANTAVNHHRFVVGWYHSHPNLGAFFSCVDRKTQTDFFNSEYNLGLVVDPQRNEEKWFIGSESLEVSPNNVTASSFGMQFSDSAR